MRCSGEGSGSKAVGWWTRFGAPGRKSSPEEHALRQDVVGRMGRAVGATSGVVVDSSRCSGRGRIGRREAGVGYLQRLGDGRNGGTVGGESWRRKKGISTVGVGAVYRRQRRWTTTAWRQGNVGQGSGSSEAVGMGKAAAAAV
jgi:hypothetical protein